MAGVLVLLARARAAVLALGAVAASAAAAPPPVPAPAADPARTPAPSVLAGPKVAEPAPRARSLVQKDFGGKLVRLEMEPARAALELMDLDDASRAKADAILLERDALLDALMTDHLREIGELAGAFEARDTAKAMRLLKPLLDAAKPIRDRGPLGRELAAALPADKGAELESLTREYWKAAVADRKARGGDNGEKLNTVGALAHEGLLVFGQELKRAYERTLGAESKHFEEFLGTLSLTPEQESIVRRETGLFFEKTYGKATPAQQRELFWKLWKVLDNTQRKTVMERIVEERKAEIAANRATANRAAPNGAAAGAKAETARPPTPRP